jgi:hypothetical protein
MVADGGLRMADCGWRIADCGWRIADCGWRIADKKVPEMQLVFVQFDIYYLQGKLICYQELI